MIVFNYELTGVHTHTPPGEESRESFFFFFLTSQRQILTASLYNLNCLVVGGKFIWGVYGDHRWGPSKSETRGFGSWESPEFVLSALDVVEPESVT